MQDRDIEEDTQFAGTKCGCKHNKNAVYHIDEADRAWEKMDNTPHDVYTDPWETAFASGAFDVGENYPRGV